MGAREPHYLLNNFKALLDPAVYETQLQKL